MFQVCVPPCAVHVAQPNRYVSRLTAYQEIVKQKEAQLASILAVEQIPEAYTAALVEVIRRRRYVASVADQVSLPWWLFVRGLITHPAVGIR